MPPDEDRARVRVQPILDADWDAIADLEHHAYNSHGLSEGRAALESRWRVSPDTCFTINIGDRLVGYTIALPYPVFEHPELSSGEETTFASDNLHLHDLVIAEDLRGAGLATILLRWLATTAQRWRHTRMSLVAVTDSEAFWSARGFRTCRGVPVSHEYGANAVYMTRELRFGS